MIADLTPAGMHAIADAFRERFRPGRVRALMVAGSGLELDVPGRRVDLLVDEETLARRRAETSPLKLPDRGWRRLYAGHVLPAHLGADLDFLLPVPKDA